MVTKVNNRMIDGAAVNVRDFGAVGDGVVDDTTAVQAAIDYAGATGGYERILGDGVFNVNTLNIINKSKLVISLELTTETIGSRTFLVQNSDAIQFKNCILEGADDFDGSTGDAVGIDFDTCTNCRVDACTVSKYGNGGIRYKDSTNMWFVENRLIGPNGINVGDNNALGIYTFAQVGSSENIFIVGNRVDGWAQGIFSSSIKNVTISNNIVTNTAGQHAFYIEPIDHGVITGNIADTPAYSGIKVQVQASSSTGETHKGVVITGNTVRNAGQAGIIVSTTVGLAEYFIGTTITGNSVFGASTGIYCDKVIQANISSNQVSGCSAYGIYAENTDGVIDGNLIHDTVWGGIVLYTMRDVVTVTDNRLSYVAQAADASKGERNSAIFSSGAYDVKLSGNSYKRDGSTATYAVFSTTSTYYLLGSNDFPSDASIRITNIAALNEDSRGSMYGTYDPSTPVLGKGGRHFHSNTTPVTGTYYKGDIIWNISPDAGTNTGWVCIATSTSGGTWRTFGTISA